jgi:hypothetical protein
VPTDQTHEAKANNAGVALMCVRYPMQRNNPELVRK